MTTLACVSALSNNHYGNSCLCVSIVNSIIMTTLACVSALSNNHHGKSGLCVSIANYKIMASLAYVSALSIQLIWQLWPMSQHCQTIIMATLAFVSALPISEVNSTLFMVKFNNLCLLNVSSIYCRFLFSFSHSNVYLYLIYYLHE